MNTAAIRLSKIFVIDEKESNPILKDIWRSASSAATEFIWNKTGGRVTWDGAVPNDVKVKTQFDNTISNSISNHVTRLQNTIIGMVDLTGLIDFKFDVPEGLKLNILNFDLDEQSKFKICLELISEELTLIDSIGENLLLTKGNRLQDIQSRQIINETFFIKFEPSLRIRNYSKLPLSP